MPADAAGRGGDAASGPTAKDGAEGGRRMMLFPLAMKYRTMKQQVKQGTALLQPLFVGSIRIVGGNALYRVGQIPWSTHPATRVMQSGIQGKGLFALRDFARDDMVIEYVGEIVGQRVADKRYGRPVGAIGGGRDLMRSAPFVTP